MVEYYLRKRYADTRLGGAHSDQGRIYLIMGKPVEVKNYAGLEKVVDCELWIYRAEGRSGLPPLMYLLFYRRDNIGDYKLYYPGPHSSLDILSTRYNRGRISNIRAYKIIRSSFPQLARATLSVIPDEANVTFAGEINSSMRVIGQIHTLPEKEVEKHYLKNFGYPAGTVDVSYSTKQILGKAMIFLTERQGVKFINYALMPDMKQPGLFFIYGLKTRMGKQSTREKMRSASDLMRPRKRPCSRESSYSMTLLLLSKENSRSV
jgi:hypothetical protein